MSKMLIFTLVTAVLVATNPAFGMERSHQLPGKTQSGAESRQPMLLLLEQAPESGDRSRPVLYVHGATFPSASSIMFKFDGISWADELNRAGFSVWGLDFAGFGGSERYPEMEETLPGPGEPLGRAVVTAGQIERAVRYIAAQSGVPKVSIIAHSWVRWQPGFLPHNIPNWLIGSYSLPLS